MKKTTNSGRARKGRLTHAVAVLGLMLSTVQAAPAAENTNGPVPADASATQPATGTTAAPSGGSATPAPDASKASSPCAVEKKKKKKSPCAIGG